MHSIMSFRSCGIASCLVLDWIELTCIVLDRPGERWEMRDAYQGAPHHHHEASFGWQAPWVWSSRSSILTLLLNWGIRVFLLLCDWGYKGISFAVWLGYLRIVDQANCTAILNVFGLSGNFFYQSKRGSMMILTTILCCHCLFGVYCFVSNTSVFFSRFQSCLTRSC
jgi:hypothetical protein